LSDVLPVIDGFSRSVKAVMHSKFTRQCTSANGTRDNQAAATRDARIHLTWSVASE